MKTQPRKVQSAMCEVLWREVRKRDADGGGSASVLPNRVASGRTWLQNVIKMKQD